MKQIDGRAGKQRKNLLYVAQYNRIIFAEKLPIGIVEAIFFDSSPTRQKKKNMTNYTQYGLIFVDDTIMYIRRTIVHL